MESMSTHEASPHLHPLLERVARGEVITITRKGIPVATLVPAHTIHQSVHTTIEALKRLRRTQRRKELSIREMMEEGRAS